MTTREKILSEALTLFSVKGYDPVTVREIAYAVGIKESSLYNHFKNKQDIFDSILAEYSGRWEAIFSNISLTGDDNQIVADDRTINMYKEMSNDQFAEIAGTIYDYYMTDDINVKLRKVLTIEQYRSATLAELFRKVSFDESLDFQAKLFAGLMEAGSFIKTDPYILALEFFSPIFLIFYKYDKDPESIQKGKDLFLRHITHFNNIYGTEQTKKG
jgi:AcrR family transcriptional regulator